MTRTLKHASLAALATLAFAAASALAAPGDLTVSNSGSQAIHPYFKSNCWNKALFPDAKANEWVFFGGIASHSQFTWTFGDLVDANCKRDATVKFTFTLGSEPPPSKVEKELKAVVDFDPAEATVIRLGDKVVVTGVEQN